MSNLLGLLGMGSNGLAAQHRGVAVAANNAANVNTPGYSRQRVDLTSELGHPGVGGVRIGTPTRMADNLLEGRTRVSQGSRGASSALAPALADLEARMTSADGDLATMWASFERLSAVPTDPLVRQAAVASVANVADGMRRRAGEVSSARAEADTRIRDIADQATGYAKEIANANKAIATSDDPVLRDRRDLAAGKLAELVGGAGRIDPDGQMRWELPDGAVLVDGDRAAAVTTRVDLATGFRAVEIVDGASRRDVTASLTGGRIGGELRFRDVDAKATADGLDQLAFDIVTNLNAVHSANAGSDGVTGRNIFVPPGAPARAAATMAIDPGLAADPARLATAAPGAGSGDNRGATALLALKDQKLGAGGTATLTDAAIDLSASLGRTTAAAEATAARDGEVAGHLAGLRDAVSGVDLDEELAKLVHFQHASEAMTRFLSAVDGMLGNLLDRL